MHRTRSLGRTMMTTAAGAVSVGAALTTTGIHAGAAAGPVAQAAPAASVGDVTTVTTTTVTTTCNNGITIVLLSPFASVPCGPAITMPVQTSMPPDPQGLLTRLAAEMLGSPGSASPG